MYRLTGHPKDFLYNERAIISGPTAMFKKLAKMIDGKDRTYVSETDRFLKRLHKQFPKLSESQRKEIEKHRQIFTRTADKRIHW